MKKYISFFVITSLFLSFNELQAADEMSIRIEGNIGATFVKRTFSEGAVFYTNRVYEITGVTGSEYDGFDFLSSDGGVLDGGAIIPSQNGYIYVVSENYVAGIDGWEKLANPAALDINGVKVFVYQKQVTANERIPIPAATGFAGASPLAKTINYALSADFTPDQMSVTVEGDENATFVKRIFANGNEFFTNRTTFFENIPEPFNNFEFLASDGNVIDKGTIIPSKNGRIYIIAQNRLGGVSGWTLIDNIEFNYSDANKTKLYIYEKEVLASERVTIPELDGFPGASPLAKVINYQVGTGIDEVKGHPNVACDFYTENNRLFIQTNNQGVVDLSIVDLSGQVVFSRKISVSDVAIPFNLHITGMYIVHLKQNDSVYSGKILLR